MRPSPRYSQVSKLERSLVHELVGLSTATYVSNERAEQPTPKAIQERIAKLRREQNELLIASGILNAAASATATTSKENKSGLLSTPTTKKLPHRSLSSMDKELLSKEFYTNEDLEELKQLFTGLIPDEVLEASHRELREKREKVLRESKEKTKAAKALLDLSTEESE